MIWQWSVEDAQDITHATFVRPKFGSFGCTDCGIDFVETAPVVRGSFPHDIIPRMVRVIDRPPTCVRCVVTPI